MRSILIAIALTAAAAAAEAQPIDTPPADICKLIETAKQLGNLLADTDAGKLSRKLIARPIIESGYVTSLEPTKDGKHAAWVSLRFRALDFQTKRAFASALCPFLKDVAGGKADELQLVDDNSGKLYATYTAASDDLEVR